MLSDAAVRFEYARLVALHAVGVERARKVLNLLDFLLVLLGDRIKLIQRSSKIELLCRGKCGSLASGLSVDGVVQFGGYLPSCCLVCSSVAAFCMSSQESNDVC